MRKSEYQYEVFASLPGYVRFQRDEDSGKNFYLRVAEHMQGSADAKIDLGEKADFLASLLEEILIDLEERLEEMASSRSKPVLWTFS